MTPSPKKQKTQDLDLEIVTSIDQVRLFKIEDSSRSVCHPWQVGRVIFRVLATSVSSVVSQDRWYATFLEWATFDFGTTTTTTTKELQMCVCAWEREKKKTTTTTTRELWTTKEDVEFDDPEQTRGRPDWTYFHYRRVYQPRAQGSFLVVLISLVILTVKRLHK